MPISQNGLTHSNNLLAKSVFDHFVGLVLKGLNMFIFRTNFSLSVFIGFILIKNSVLKTSTFVVLSILDLICLTALKLFYSHEFVARMINTTYSENVLKLICLSIFSKDSEATAFIFKAFLPALPLKFNLFFTYFYQQKNFLLHNYGTPFIFLKREIDCSKTVKKTLLHNNFNNWRQG